MPRDKREATEAALGRRVGPSEDQRRAIEGFFHGGVVGVTCTRCGYRRTGLLSEMGPCPGCADAKGS